MLELSPLVHIFSTLHEYSISLFQKPQQVFKLKLKCEKTVHPRFDQLIGKGFLI